MIWVDMINIFIVKIDVFCNIIWLSKIKWLWLISDDMFILILIMMKVDFSFKARIDWLRLWCSCCISDNYQKLLWSWKLWLISWFADWLTSLIRLALSVAVIILRKSFTKQKVNWHEIQLHVEYMCKLIIEILIE